MLDHGLLALSTSARLLIILASRHRSLVDQRKRLGADALQGQTNVL